VRALLFLSRLHFPVHALGPGRRIGLWVQGCSLRCPGCISADTWRSGTGEVPVAAVLKQLAAWASEADGLTVSGGEPLEQGDALAELLAGWRRLSDASVLLFTGLEWAAAKPWFLSHPGLVDAVIAGPYVASAGQTLALRGSDNQTLHVLTHLGEHFRQFERERTAADRRLDVMFDEGGIWFAGIPEPGDFDKMGEALRAGGAEVRLSADQAAA
jgi:anaerobic ribonucleoside-triphosphate reductase activating protein